MKTMKAHRRLLTAFCVLCAALAAATVNGQTPRNNSNLDSFRQLLLMPAPTPRTPNAGSDQEVVSTRPPHFYRADQAPPDDAPLQDLLDFWLRWANSSERGKPEPSDVVRERLLAASESAPENLVQWLPLLGEAPAAPEYYLLDAATGQVRLAPGTFAPLRQAGKRLLQSTGKPDEVWAAIPKDNQTEVGRYNLKDFSFELLLKIPHLTFESSNLWVDGEGGKLYVVYKGQLLRLPLPGAR